MALDIFEGSVTKEQFIDFLKNQIVSDMVSYKCFNDHQMKAPILTPWPGPRSVVILDNCAIHHDEYV